MKNLNIAVANKVASYCQRDGFIVCGNSDYQITFTFDSEWNSHDKKTARFKWNGGYRDIAIKDDNTVDVPIIENTTEIEIGVYVEDLSTTTPALIPCTRSILCGSASEYLTPEDVSSLEKRLLAACTMYRHKYEIVVGSYGVTWAEIEFIIYSTSPGSLEGKDDFVNIIDSAIYKSPFVVWVYDQSGGNRDGNRLYIGADKKFTVYYDKVESDDTGYFTASTYTVRNVEIMEA